MIAPFSRCETKSVLPSSENSRNRASLIALSGTTRVTRGAYAIESSDPQFNLTETRKFLETLGPKEVIEVPR